MQPSYADYVTQQRRHGDAHRAFRAAGYADYSDWVIFLAGWLAKADQQQALRAGKNFTPLRR